MGEGKYLFTSQSTEFEILHWEKSSPKVPSTFVCNVTQRSVAAGCLLASAHVTPAASDR
jgi:hypothetical protein